MRWNEVKWSEVRWIKWNEVRWGEVTHVGQSKKWAELFAPERLNETCIFQSCHISCHPHEQSVQSAPAGGTTRKPSTLRKATLSFARFFFEHGPRPRGQARQGTHHGTLHRSKRYERCSIESRGDGFFCKSRRAAQLDQLHMCDRVVMYNLPFYTDWLPSSPRMLLKQMLKETHQKSSRKRLGCRGNVTCGNWLPYFGWCSGSAILEKSLARNACKKWWQLLLCKLNSTKLQTTSWNCLLIDGNKEFWACIMKVCCGHPATTWLSKLQQFAGFKQSDIWTWIATNTGEWMKELESLEVRRMTLRIPSALHNPVVDWESGFP